MSRLLADIQIFCSHLMAVSQESRRNEEAPKRCRNGPDTALRRTPSSALIRTYRQYSDFPHTCSCLMSLAVLCFHQGHPGTRSISSGFGLKASTKCPMTNTYIYLLIHLFKSTAAEVYDSQPKGSGLDSPTSAVYRLANAV